MNYLDYSIPKYQSPWGTLKTIPRRLIQKIQNLKNKALGTHDGELENIKVLKGTGTDVVSLDENVIRVTPDTEQRGTLFNEFVENGRNRTIRTAEEYKKLSEDQNATIGDKKIPLKNINLFLGIEDGHIKADSLKNFNDTTTIIPFRNIKKDTPLISSFYLPEPSQPVSEEDFKEAQKTRKRYDDLFPKEPDSTKAYYEIEKRLGRAPAFEELQNLTRRLYLSSHLKDGYTLPENINELIAPLNDEEQIKLKNLPTQIFERTLSHPYHVNDRFINKIKTENTIPIALRNELSGIVHSFMDDKNIHNDSISYSLIYPEKKDIDKYLTYKRMDKAPLQEALKITRKYNDEKRGVPKESAIEGLQVITQEGDTIPVGQYNASILDKKTVLANPQGGMFIADFNNLTQGQLDTVINPYLQQHPSWLYMPDMGAYSLYGLQNGVDPRMQKIAKQYGYDISEKPTYNEYWNQFSERKSEAPYNPQVHYLIGVKKQGGALNYLNYFNNK